MDQELIAYLDRRFSETAQQIEGVRNELRSEFRSEIGGLRGEVGGLRGEVGGLRGEVGELRAEVGELRERVDELATQVHHNQISVEHLRHGMQLLAEANLGVSERVERLSAETLLGFEEVKASIAPYYENVNRRVTLLEQRADRQDRDAMEVLHEHLGHPPAA